MSKLLTVVRLLASAPLLLIGIQHLTGAAPMQPILEGARMPLPELSAILAPAVEVVAGALLISGFQARLGAVLAILTMVGAVFAHVRHDWADEPTLLLPVAVIILAAVVLLRGPGAFALAQRIKKAS